MKTTNQVASTNDNSSIQHIPNSSYEKLSKKYNNENNQIRFIAYQKALNPVVLNGHGKTNTIAVDIASDLINATLNNRLDAEGYFKIRYNKYAIDFGKSNDTIKRAVNLLRDLGIVIKEQKSYNNFKTHCANAIHLKLNVAKLLEVAPNLRSQFSKNLCKMHPLSMQNAPIIHAKCTDVDNLSNALKQDNLDAKSCESEVLNIVEEEKVSKETVHSSDESLDSSYTSDKICNLMKFHPVSQRVADEINKRAGRSFSMRFINMRIEKLNEKYKDSNKTVFKNEYGFISYMGKLFQGEKIQEFVANRIDFEFKTKLKPIPIASITDETTVEVIDESTTLGKIQARALAQHGVLIYRSWFKELSMVTECDKRLVIDCRGSFKADYIKQNYYKTITESCNAKVHPWWIVSETKLIIPMEEAIVAENSLTDSIALVVESVQRIEEKQENDNEFACNSIVYTESDDNICNDEALEEINTSNPQNTENIIKTPRSLLNFVKNIDNEEKQVETVEPKAPQTEDEMLAAIAEKLSENDKTDTFDEEKEVF